MILAFGMYEELCLLAVGAGAGLLGGLLGVGGGIIMIPAMAIILGDQYGQNSFHVYKLASITATIVLSGLACSRHRRAGAIVTPMVRSQLPLATLGVILGVLVAGTFVGDYTPILRRIFGGFLELVALVNVYQALLARRGTAHLVDRCPMPRRWALLGTVVGLPSGIIAGLLGIGGGVWAVPAQRLLIGVRIRNAIANSATLIVGIAVAANISLSLQLARIAPEQQLYLTGWRLAAWLVPGALGGAWIGAGLTHRLPTGWLRYAFQALLIVSGLRLLLG